MRNFQLFCILLVLVVGAEGQTPQPGVDQPGMGQPGVDQPTVGQPGVGQPTVDQPAVDQPPTAAQDTSYQGITGKQRLQWLVKSTVGPQSLASGVFSAAISTADNRPVEYGPHWEGFGKRYGMRLTGVSTGHAMEAGLGALWGEDPRYFRSDEHAFQGRLKHVVVMTFAARREDGHVAPAYARLISVPASNFLSNTWRADSVATNSAAAQRTLFGFAGRLGSNAFAEFWPDVKKHLFHKKNQPICSGALEQVSCQP